MKQHMYKVIPHKNYFSKAERNAGYGLWDNKKDAIRNCLRISKCRKLEVTCYDAELITGDLWAQGDIISKEIISSSDAVSELLFKH